MVRFKANPVLTTVALIMIGLIFLQLLFVASLNPSEGATSLFLWFIIPVFLIAFFEGNRWYFLKSLKIDESKFKSHRKNLWTMFAYSFQYINAVRTIFGMVLVLAAFCFVSYFITIPVLLKEIVLTNQSYMYLGTICTYVILRVPIVNILSKIIKPIFNFSKKYVPSYVLKKEGIEISLNYIEIGKKKIKNIFIGYNEIDEIRVFNFVEAKEFLKYSIGPDAKLAMKNIKQRMDFIKGKIPRPNILITDSISIWPIVFIKGPNLFYFTGFNKKNVNDLLDAYKKYKKKR